MKIKQEHAEYITLAITSAMESRPTLTDYQSAGLTEKRYRWDLTYRAKLSPWISKNIYPYANDAHLDTLLRQITRTH